MLTNAVWLSLAEMRQVLMASVGSSVIFGLSNAILYARNPRLVWRYIHYHHRLPNISNPQRYAERMLWRKTIDRNPQFVVFSDKLAAKEYSARICPDLAFPRTLWIGDDADAIPDKLLRGNVVVKANHGCGFNRQIRAGQVDRAELKATTSRWLSSVYGVTKGEWSYAKVAPQLFVEEAIGDAQGELLELQVRAGNGKAILGSLTGHAKMPDEWIVYLDLEGNPTAGVKDEVGAPITPIPEGIEVLGPYRRAVRYAQRLSVGVDYARFDFMWNGTDLFGGEITVYPASGARELANPTVHAAIVGGWDLTQSHFLRMRHAGLTRIYADALHASVISRSASRARTVSSGRPDRARERNGE